MGIVVSNGVPNRSSIGIDRVGGFERPAWSNISKSLKRAGLNDFVEKPSYSPIGLANANVSADFYELAWKYREEPLIIVDTNIRSKAYIAKDSQYKELLENAAKSGEVFRTAIINEESKQGGISTPEKQDALLEVDVANISEILDDATRADFQILWKIGEQFIKALIASESCPVGNQVFHHKLSGVFREDRERMFKKLREWREKGRALTPMINDFCILFFSIFCNIFTRRRTMLLSNDGDMPVLAEIFMNHIVPEFFAEKIMAKAELEKGSIDSLLVGAPDDLELYNREDYCRAFIASKARGYIQSVHHNPKDPNIKKVPVLVVVNPEKGTIDALNILEPMMCFLRLDGGVVFAKTSIILYAIEHGRNPVDVLDDVVNGKLSEETVLGTARQVRKIVDR